MIPAPPSAPGSRRALLQQKKVHLGAGVERCCFSPTSIAVLGDPLGSSPKPGAFRLIESGLTPKYAPTFFLFASKTLGPRGRGSRLAGLH